VEQMGPGVWHAREESRLAYASHPGVRLPRYACFCPRDHCRIVQKTFNPNASSSLESLVRICKLQQVNMPMVDLETLVAVSI
jgi:hypothetical protein